MNNKTRTRFRSFLFRAAVGAAAACVCVAVWNKVLAPATAETHAGTGRVLPPVLDVDPEHVIDVRTAPNGDIFYWREGGVERLDASGKIIWRGVSIDRPNGLPPLDVYNVAPTPEGDLLAIGVLADQTRRMGIYRVAGNPPQVSAVGLLAGMDPADIAVTPKGEIFALAMPSTEVNRAIKIAPKEAVDLEFGLLHEITVDGRLGRSLAPRNLKLASSQDAIQAVEDFHTQRLLVDGGGGLYVYGGDTGLLRRIDTASGRVVGSLSLPYGDFPAEIRILNIQFMDSRNLVYSIAEFDTDKTVVGSRTYQLDVVSGVSSLVAKQTTDEGLWATHFNPFLDTLVSIDILNAGGGGIRPLPWPTERATRQGRGSSRRIRD